MIENNGSDGKTNDFIPGKMMRRVWAVQMDILNEIKDLCERHSLRWWVDFGTLLGTVRNSGYIPWDDDIDLGMTRIDALRFLKYAADELKDLHMVNAAINDRTDLVLCLKKDGCFPVDEDYLIKNHRCPYPVGIDIFIYDNIPDDADERELLIAVFSYAFTAGKEIKEGILYDELTEEQKSLVDEVERLTRIKIDRNLSIKAQMLEMADKIAAMYYDASTEDMAVVGYLPLDRTKCFKKQWFDKSIPMSFENIKVPVPVGYDNILRVWYGDDYMIPKRECADHDYPYYKKFEQQLRRWHAENGSAFPEEFED